MKKSLKIISVVLISILAVTVLAIGGYKVMKQIEHNEMVKIVKSEEAEKIFKNRLKRIDSKAFEQDGIIKTYKINYESVTHNPMGGIIVYLYVNNNKKYKVTVFLGKNQGKIEGEGGSWSPELDKLVKKKVTGNE